MRMERVKISSVFLAMARSTAIYSLATLVNSLVRFAILAVAARVLVLEDYGALDALLFTALAFSSLVILGFDSTILRFAFDKEARSPEILSTTLLLLPISILIFLLGFALFLFFRDQPFLRIGDLSLLASLIMFSTGFGLSAICGAQMRAKFEEVRFLAASVSATVIRLGAIGPFIVFGTAQLEDFMLVLSAAYLLSGLLFLAFNFRWLTWSGFDFTLIRRMLKFGLPLCAVVALASTYPVIERMVVLEIGGSIWLSVFASSAFPAILLGVAIQVINLAWVPLALKFNQEKTARQFFKISPLLIQFLFIMLYIIFLFFSAEIVDLLAPIEVDNPAQLFPFIGMVMVVRLTAAFTSFGLIVEKRTGLKFLINASGFIAGAILSYAAGSEFGVEAIPVALFSALFAAMVIEAAVARHYAPNVEVPYQLMALSVLAAGGIAFWRII